ncbi:MULTISPECIES: helix-turn-helix transcriptional regulator [Sinorhizobium]|uniref:AraC family transcriptional regulator n=2 Tax=Sinorhizobium TaxID=28105 RepID=A0A2S3YK35_9HYPH|nr:MULTISPECIES: AraC family transcriptional regulator [Sinorhizobium]ASY59691.1 putative transcriptional regulator TRANSCRIPTION REGULATOR protein [Sinorhizobium sp. CCBAU 05631]AUX79919.1 AraC family transcriptional regulator protein [Sinorhizobium fredii]PDT41524.1 AraC family transcriptional regulator [Sinorhizobium sp. FG01]POH27724.1 AraC family transcriptional regulator [Sinorhizobium americanum]
MRDRPTGPGSEEDEAVAPATQPQPERRRWPRDAPIEASRSAASPALTPLHFSTRNLRPDEQFQAWRAHMAPLVEVRLPDNIPPEDGFVAEQTAWHCGNLLIVQQRAPGHSYLRPQAMLRASPIDHWYVELLRSGMTWTEVDRRVAENGPGRLVFRSLGYPFRGRATAAESVLLFMPYELFADDAAVFGETNNLVLSGNLADLLINYINGIEPRLDRLTAEEIPRIVQTVHDMVVACVASSARPDAGGLQTNKGMMERAHRYIHLNLHSAELTPDAIARAIGVSRTRLYQLFEASGGVLNYIRRRRLQQAHAALSDPADSRPIAEIAEAAGFDVAANFTRAFSHEFGVSPREIRKAAATERPVAPAVPAGRHRGSTIGDWLKALGT